MDELQRAQRLLNSPIEGDHRKAIKLLAKSGDRRALALLRHAYDNAQSAEIKQMALKGGAYLKENLRADVLAPAADPITFDLPEDNYDLDEPNTSAIQPEIEADWMRSAVKGESKREAKARQKQKKSSREGNRIEVVSALIVIVCGIVMLATVFSPWVSLDNLEVVEGVTIAEDIATAIPYDPPHALFKLGDTSSVLNGVRSPWWVFTTDAQLDAIWDYPTWIDLHTDRTTAYANGLESLMMAGPLLAAIFMIIIAAVMLSDSEYRWGRTGASVMYGLLTIVFRILPNRMLWIILICISLFYGVLHIIFLFDVLPRFAHVAIKLMRLDNPTYQTYELLEIWFFVSAAAVIVALITSFIGLSSYDTQTKR